LVDILNDIKNKQLAYDLAVVALEVNEGRSSPEKIFETLERFERKQETETVEFVTTDLEELYNGAIQKQGLRWRLKTLNRMLGSLRLGDFGFIFARPETGKTTFLASEVTFFATQVEGPILWFNNEEQGSKVMLRCYQASLGISTLDLYRDLRGNQEKFYSLGGGNIRLFDSANIHRRQVEQLCKELNPSLVIFDQIDKIKGFDNDREDLRLGSIYIWAREIAKTYCPVIGVSQADATGEGKRWLTMENVANAKTAKQAEADWILGIGKTHDASLEFIRHFHLSKNKLTGDEDTDPTLRHGKCDVAIKPEIARYADVEF
jgi:replicative DNA helicase